MQAIDLLDELTKARAEVLQLRAQLEVLRDQDPLTGLPNRLRLSDRTGQAILRARRQGNMVSVLFIELDRFKTVNQTLEFAEADELILQLTRRILVLLASGDTLARVGTDQFVVLLPDVQDAQQPLRMAQAMLDAVRIPYRVAQREVRLTASIGISLSPQDGDDAPSLQKEAENATNRAKAAGGNSIQCTTLTLSEASFERQQMEAYLGQAILKNEMQVFYQPQTNAAGRIFGMEALLRWEHPVLGTVPPSKFVPLAEENLFIHAMGEWTLSTACHQAAIWQAMCPRPVKLAVNVSPIQLTQPRWVDFVARTLRESRLSPSCLELEITESTLLKNVKTSQSILHDLKALGVHFGIDDFGTGYSSLSYLHHLPIDTLKIDQTFVRGMFPSQPGVISSLPIVQTIIHLGRDMGMQVVAEGVETPEQHETLVKMGCYGFQGYLLGRPMEASELTLRLESQITTAFNALLPPD
ncbi:MAG: EAL domain-containing protein [Holophaga sp.]|nr:EAL domain-containing protein [Holophaga sp.]